MNEEESKYVIGNLNKLYELNNYNGEIINGLNYKIILGSIPILFSAPHAVKQIRNGNVKNQDAMTGGLVEYLASHLNAFGITRVANLEDDPNFYNEGFSLEYKNQILKLIEENNIKLLIDIHGCKDTHGFDIEIGTNKGKNINFDSDVLEIFVNNLSEVGLVSVDTLFMASREETVSCYVHNTLDIVCLQIEISSKIRFDEERLLQFVRVLECAIKKVLENNFTISR